MDFIFDLFQKAQFTFWLVTLPLNLIHSKINVRKRLQYNFHQLNIESSLKKKKKKYQSESKQYFVVFVQSTLQWIGMQTGWNSSLARVQTDVDIPVSIWIHILFDADTSMEIYI